MSLRLDDAKIKVTLDTGEAERRAEKLSKQLDRTGQSANRTQRELQRVGRAGKTIPGQKAGKGALGVGLAVGGGLARKAGLGAVTRLAAKGGALAAALAVGDFFAPEIGSIGSRLADPTVQGSFAADVASAGIKGVAATLGLTEELRPVTDALDAIRGRMDKLEEATEPAREFSAKHVGRGSANLTARFNAISSTVSALRRVLMAGHNPVLDDVPEFYGNEVAWEFAVNRQKRYAARRMALNTTTALWQMAKTNIFK